MTRSSLFSFHWAKTLRQSALIMVVTWSLVILASFAWNSYQHEQAMLENARIIARTAFEKDVLYRRWSSLHGGVYVPVDDANQPNSYLAEDPRQNIISREGITYTLINPAYMTRQVFELQRGAGILGHITSLKPLNPGNAADAWETAALQSFDRGTAEVSSLEQIDGQGYLRLMRPLNVDESCLICHAKQGYQIGQVRGGISESVRMQPLQAAGQSYQQTLSLAHGGIWLAGLLGIFISTLGLRVSLRRQKELEDRLVEISTHDALTGLYNRRHFEDAFMQLESTKDKTVAVLVADMDGLKKINDQYGHEAGDELLRVAGEALGRSFRNADIVARVGGDEFMVILPATGADQAKELLLRVHHNLDEYNAGGPRFPVSLSIGLATSEPGESLAATLERADKAMYAEKAARKAKTKPE